jgi:hypothetical protein
MARARPGTRLHAILVAMWALVALGCEGVPIDVIVNSMHQPDLAGPCRYCLEPARPEVAYDDAQFRQFAAAVEQLLAQHGFERVSRAEADELVLLDFGILPEQPVRVRETSWRYGLTGGGMEPVLGTTFGAGNDAPTTPTAYEPAHWGVTEKRVEVKFVMERPLFLALHAFDRADAAEAEEAEREARPTWYTKAWCLWPEPEIEEAFPFLLVATSRHVGRWTNEIVKHTLYTGDPEVATAGAAAEAVAP